MTRIQFIIDPKTDFQTDRAAEALATLAGECRAEVVRLGAHPLGRLSTLRKLRSDASQTDVVHAFGAGALTVAALSFGGPIVYTPVGFPSRQEIGWLRAVGAYRDVHVVASTTTMYRALASRGVRADRIDVVRVGVDFSRAKGRRDDSLRARLGFGPEDFVCLTAGESTTAAAHERAVWAGSILRKLDTRVSLLIWGKGGRAKSVARFGVNIGERDLVSVATETLGPDISFESLFPAADCVLVTATRPVPTLPIATAMAAGKPIIATVSPAVAELVEDRHTCLMVKGVTPREIARRISDLRADARLAWSLADTARAEAYEHFSLTRFLSEHRTLYARVGLSVTST